MRRSISILVAFGVIAAACAGAEPTARPMPVLKESGPVNEAVPPPSTTTPMQSPAVSEPVAETFSSPTSPPPPSDLPDVTVVDLAGGEFRLASLVPSDKPIVLWFWAPH